MLRGLRNIGTFPAGFASEDPDAAHPFVTPDDPAELKAARGAYYEAMHRRIIEQLSKTPPSKRRRSRPVE